MTTLTLKNITLTQDAELTNNVFHNSFTQVADGDTYVDQWQAEGVTDDGQKVVVTWEFDLIKGETGEDYADFLDWDAPACIEAA